ADTTAAVCGQIAGAYWGEAGIAGELLDGLAKREMIEEALAGLISTSSPVSPATMSPIHPESRPAKLAPRPIRIDMLPARPEFLTSNRRNKTENEAVVDRAWKLAATGDLAG